jgi:hypothetical protein
MKSFVDPYPEFGPFVPPKPFSAAVHRLAAQAISEGTRKTYRIAQGQYRAYCTRTGQDGAAGAMTPQSVAGFIADLGERARHLPATIRTYRSALSTLWTECTLGEGGASNPVTSVAVERVLKGIAKRDVEAAIQRRCVADLHMALTPELLSSITLTGLAQDESPEIAMMLAAAHLGVYALLRPSELLGSAQHRDRALRVDQVVFSDGPASEMSRGRHRSVGLFTQAQWLQEAAAANCPDRMFVLLGATKADPLALNPPILIASIPAVLAVWRWMHIRLFHGAECPELFRLPGKQPLSTAELTRWLSAKVSDVLGRPVTILGRAMRRGGASGLVSAGVPAADVAAAGRWRTVAMVDLYSSSESKAQRAERVSRQMAPAAASSSSSQ